MNRILKIQKDDIILSPRETALMIEETAYRNNKNFIATGICDFSSDFIFVVLEESTGNTPKRRYIFSPMQGYTEDDFINTVNTRYYADFSTLGAFFIENNLWGIFYNSD